MTGLEDGDEVRVRSFLGTANPDCPVAVTYWLATVTDFPVAFEGVFARTKESRAWTLATLETRPSRVTESTISSQWMLNAYARKPRTTPRSRIHSSPLANDETDEFGIRCLSAAR
eukprot:2999415-Pleurochrysis_carterae.AAC.1